MSAEITHAHAYGEPINIVKFADNNEFIILTQELNNIFSHPDVKNRAVVVFSIVGAFRKGKSFLLDYCLRFLYANYPSINNPNNRMNNAENWMGNEDEPLSGFSWRTGAARDTSGIVMWSDIFLHTVENTGEKLAIVVMDTQGLFDNETTPIDNSRIFALGTLVSSIQVLNLSGVVQEDQLQYLQFATEFAKFAANDSHGTAGKPFQNLMFLLRDWAYIDDFDYGIVGGEEYLQDFLKINTSQKSIIKSVREHIRGSFEELSCSLLPHPGKIVAGGIRQEKKYDGRWIGMDTEFRDHLFALIEHLLKPDRLVPKKINGEFVKGAEFLAYILQYFQLFQTDRMPHAHSIYESTIEQQMNILVSNCFSDYKETLFKNQNIVTDVGLIPILHKMSKAQAVLKFKESRKMGNEDHETKFRKILESQIDEIFGEWESQTKDSIEKIQKEMENARVAVEEKLKLQQEQFESERKALERLQELEKVKYENDLKDQKHEQEKKIAEERWKAEKEKLERIMAEKQRDDALAQKLEAEKAKENWEKKYSENPWERLCRIM